MRTAAVNDKITYAAEVQSMLRQLLNEVSCYSPLFAKILTPEIFSDTQSSTHSMELIIIALIAVEVVIVRSFP